MDCLYRKIKTPGGATRYVPTFSMDTGCPTDGLWYVRRCQYGRSYRWLAEQVFEPDDLRIAWNLEQCRDAICMEIVHNRTSLDEMVTRIFEAIREGQKNE